MKRIMYSPDIKWKVIELKKQGMNTKYIMDTLNIKNRSQINTW